MSETTNESGGTGPSHRSVEIGVACFMALLALIGIYGSIKVGIGWAADGPRAGFFPFYVSLIVLISCAVNLAQVFAISDDRRSCSRNGASCARSLSVVMPTAIYVARRSLYRHLCGVRAADRGRS